MKTYRFFWSLEGRPICDVEAHSEARAENIFHTHYPEYARYMGDVYTEVNPCDWRGIPMLRAEV